MATIEEEALTPVSGDGPARSSTLYPRRRLILEAAKELAFVPAYLVELSREAAYGMRTALARVRGQSRSRHSTNL